MQTALTQSRKFACKPDFDECMARIYGWYQQKIIDRPPVRFHHHNIEYERHRTMPGPWKSVRERWLDVDFQVKTFLVFWLNEPSSAMAKRRCRQVDC